MPKITVGKAEERYRVHRKSPGLECGKNVEVGTVTGDVFSARLMPVAPQIRERERER